MRWSDEDPGAGDVGPLRDVACALDDIGQRLYDAIWDVRGAADPLGTVTWSGQAADAWQDAYQSTEHSWHLLTQGLVPYGDALVSYANGVEQIAHEADIARRSQAIALEDLARAARTAPPPASTAQARRRAQEASEDRRDVERRLRESLEDLADDRRRADQQLTAVLGDLPRLDWSPALSITVPVPAPRTTPTNQTARIVHGAFALEEAANRTVTLATRANSFDSWWHAHRREPRNPRVALQRQLRMQETLREFSTGKAAGFSRLAGRAFLPLTVFSGTVDAMTGGGYDGARGWATRGFGVAGAVGAGALFGSVVLGAFALTPIGAAVAVGAVLAYTAWSAGNFIWDNSESIARFVTAAGSTIRDGARAVADAGSWLRTRLTGAATDLGSRLLRAPRAVFP